MPKASSWSASAAPSGQRCRSSPVSIRTRTSHLAWSRPRTSWSRSAPTRMSTWPRRGGGRHPPSPGSWSRGSVPPRRSGSSRFSGVWSGRLDRDKMEGLTDLDGVSVAQALDTTGIRGRTRRGPFRPIPTSSCTSSRARSSSRKERIIGIVTGAQAQVWSDAVVSGKEAHAGTTPPAARKDALLASARIVDLVDRLMRARGPGGRGTVGQMTAAPEQPQRDPGGGAFLGRIPPPRMRPRSSGSTRTSGARRARSSPARACTFRSQNCSSCQPSRSTPRASTLCARPRPAWGFRPARLSRAPRMMRFTWRAVCRRR